MDWRSPRRGHVVRVGWARKVNGSQMQVSDFGEERASPSSQELRLMVRGGTRLGAKFRERRVSGRLEVGVDLGW